ncbi:hypothetical protein FA95DRAFT_1601614 [Auriscalpium vulgare]|uniref:Uncharacterized protein n=1 Tax=Auriscalpium vulgare TaxID=40419 RepID=A0ACB8S9T9_9AGAM|nr:hypothetical protein FA95DRAFT_1601614 [Auriscalpium vulgare]
MNTQIVDLTNVATNRIRDDESIADKNRFESFKLGGSAGSPHATVSNRRLSHSRSHSRNNSVSPSPSLSFSNSTNSTSDSATFPISASTHSNSSLAGQRSSHHRRRSSVSTRRESAEMMGVSLPALPASLSEDNINLGDKDSIRRRALWALEGKSGADVFSPVNIPELNTPELERRMFELPSKPSYPPGLGGGFGAGLSGLSNKRESFGKHIVSSSIKDQLHTLVEEDDEDEEKENEAVASLPVDSSHAQASDSTHFSVFGSVTTPSPARHRPTGLTLRPLALTPEATAVASDLPTPSYSPSPKVSGLKSLTLASSPGLVASPSVTESPVATIAMRRQSMVLPPVTAPSTALFRRSSLSSRADSLSSVSTDSLEQPKRRSSISYKPSVPQYVHGLPTPELTPTTERRTSLDSESDWGRHSSFLHQSQAALVARITDLERALTSRSRSRSRPDSCTSDVSAQSGTSLTSEPSDEMLQLIADLKEERDELKRDVEGWRTRVSDLEKQTGLLARRVDQERREAWVSRERLGLVEVEKRAAVKDAEEKATFAEETLSKFNALQGDFSKIKADYEDLQAAFQAKKDAEDELARLKSELAEEKRCRGDLEKELESAGLLGTPTPGGFKVNNVAVPFTRRRGMMSIDSESSSTDVESIDEGFCARGLELKVVLEEDESGQMSDEENVLASYEDEDEEDENYGSPDSSFSGSLGDSPRLTSHLQLSAQVAASPSASLATTPTLHERRASLSKTWSFPSKSSVPVQSTPEKVDRFFGCLEDLEDSPPMSAFTAAAQQGAFSKGFFGADDDDDDLPPFVLPADVGVEVNEPNHTVRAELHSGLDAVVEEEEPEEESDVSIVISEVDEIVGEEVEGGIRFTFSPPADFGSPSSTEFVRTPSPSTSLSKTIPFHETFMEEDEDSFSFTQPDFTSELKAVAFPDAPVMIRKSADVTKSPSAIPRAVSLKRFETPTKSALPKERFSPLSSSPTKHGISRPSFLPQPRKESPTASRYSPPARPVTIAPTFLPQPQRKSPSAVPSGNAEMPVSVSNLYANGALSKPRSLFNALNTGIANLMPMTSFPWSSRSSSKVAVAAAAALCIVPDSDSSSTVSSVNDRPIPVTSSQAFLPRLFGPGKQAEGKRGFVSKERQLERLRTRMQEEWKTKTGDIEPNVPCLKCADDPMAM